MAPKLRISAGSDVAHLETIHVNHDLKPFALDGEHFRGRLTVRVKNFHGETPDGASANGSAAYFQEPYGDGMTYSIQVQGMSTTDPGCFPENVSADNLVFGNEFDRPIRVGGGLT